MLLQWASLQPVMWQTWASATTPAATNPLRSSWCSILYGMHFKTTKFNNCVTATSGQAGERRQVAPSPLKPFYCVSLLLLLRTVGDGGRDTTPAVLIRPPLAAAVGRHTCCTLLCDKHA